MGNQSNEKSMWKLSVLDLQRVYSMRKRVSARWRSAMAHWCLVSQRESPIRSFTRAANLLRSPPDRSHSCHGMLSSFRCSSIFKNDLEVIYFVNDKIMVFDHNIFINKVKKYTFLFIRTYERIIDPLSNNFWANSTINYELVIFEIYKGWYLIRLAKSVSRQKLEYLLFKTQAFIL